MAGHIDHCSQVISCSDVARNSYFHQTDKNQFTFLFQKINPSNEDYELLGHNSANHCGNDEELLLGFFLVFPLLPHHDGELMAFQHNVLVFPSHHDTG